MVQEPELEEGETCYYKDDANIDPDIALSYIGDKVQSILGHLQKDFEGGVCAENLGAKFGGYGSFLPTHQRSPSIWLQPKSPPRVQISHLPRSPNACSEGPAPKSVIPSTQRDDASSSPSVRASQTLKTYSHDASIRQKATLSSGKVDETFPGKVELPSSKLGNPLDQRTLKVRIKVGPERVAQYNAQIYSLGLTSPSSSEGNSHDESDELLLETHEIPNESPTYMLKMMTSFPVSNGLLLSPLCEDLLNWTREREYFVESEYEAAPKNSAITIKILNNDASRGKKTKAVDKRENFDKSKDNLEDLDGCVQKTVRGDNMECNMQPFHDLNCKSLPDRVRDTDKNVLINTRESKNRVKGRAVSGDSVKDVSFEHTSDQSHGKYEQLKSRCSSRERIEENRARISQKDVSVDRGQVGKSGGKGCYPSFKAYSDHSEGERVEKAVDDSTLKTGLNSTSSGFDPRPVGRLSIEGGKKLKVSKSSGRKASKSDSFRDGDCAAPKKKSSGRKDVHKLHLGKKDVVHTSLEHMEHPEHLLERPSVDSPKNFNLDDVKAKPALADKLKERSSKKKYLDRVSSDSHGVEPPAAAIQSKKGIFSGLEPTVAAPVLIQEDWVCCDRCETWRLLPYGTKSKQLPDKWVCSMLDWLPGLNRCDVSEDETSAAIRTLNQVPVPENQHNFQAHANGTLAGSITASAHDFNQSHLNFASDQMKKQKLKKRQSTVGTSYPLHSNSQTQMQMPQLDLENGSSKDVKPSLARVHITNQFDMQYPSKSASVSVKLNKRKGDHVIGDDSNPRKKIKESGEYLHGKGQMKRIKSTDVCIVDNVQNSCGNLGVNGHGVTSGLPSKTAVKHGKKKSAQKDEISGGLGNIQINVKRENIMQDLPDNGPLGVEMCNGRQVTSKKIKLKDYVYSQHQVETQQNNGSTLQDRKASVNEDSKDGDTHRDKKSRVPHIEDDEFSRGQDGDISKRSVEIRSLGAKECPTNRSIEKEQQVKKPRAKMRLTIEDIDELRKDLGCEHLSMAATSSSSKVSDSRKNRLSYVEVKGSPEESVSSSPMRMLYPNQVSPLMAETTGKVDCMFNDVGAVSSVKKLEDMNESSEFGTARRRTSGLTILDAKNKSKKETAVDDNHHAPKHELSSNMRHPLSHDLSLKSVKNPSVGKNNIRKSKDSRSEKQSTQREHDKNDLESSNPCNSDVIQQNLKQERPRSSIEQDSAQMEPWSGKVRIDLRQGDKQGALRPSKHASGSMGSLKRSPMDSRPRDASVLGDTSKTLKGTTIACIENRTEILINKEAVALDASLRNKNVSGATASTGLKEAEDVLKEAEEFRTHADLIKNSGFGSESNYEYFKAALKFLLGASLLEACNAEPSKQMETSPMQMYGAAAQLCKICASEYEKGHELTFAALAYKCMEVAYLRVVYCKSSSASRFCQDLQSGLHMVPQGESPSSSASDVDNLNNLAMADKLTLSKGSGSHAGNHYIVPRNRPNFVRLLDFTKDVNSAMEAAKKSQDTFAAAHVELKKSQNKDAIISVKKVIDFSFQDVEELVRLVWLAFNTINHQGLRGDRE